MSKASTRNALPDDGIITVGLIADTHIPDQVSQLHPEILPIFREAGVTHILHAGDIVSMRVLEELRQVAPVTAVRGNRDLFIRPLKMVEFLDFGSVRVALMHGHGGWIPYLIDKWDFLIRGYKFSRYLDRLIKTSQDAQVVVFGHTHFPERIKKAGKLLINPGSASFGYKADKPPSIGLLYVYPSGEVRCEIKRLHHYRVKNRKWVKKDRL